MSSITSRRPDAAQRTEEIAKAIERVLLANPDVESYVRRSGTQLGLFATKTNRGDIQVVLRPAEDDPVSLLTKPVRPKFSEIEDEIKRDRHGGGTPKIPPPAASGVMKEVEDAVKEQFSEHQLKVETNQIMEDNLNDLSGANRPIEVKLFGPRLRRSCATWRRRLPDRLQTDGKGKGIKDVDSNVFEGNPDLMIRVDGARAARCGLGPDEVERQLRAIYFGQVATQVRESAHAHHRCARPLPRRAALRPRVVRPRSAPRPVAAGAGRRAPPPANAGGSLAFRPLLGPARKIEVSSLADVTPMRTPDERDAREPAAGHLRDRES